MPSSRHSLGDRGPGRVIPLRRFRRRRGPLAREPGEPEAFEAVRRAGSQAEALVIRGLLEAHGIRVALRTHVAPSVHPFTVGEQGEVQVLVPRSAAVQSRRLLLRLTPGSSPG